MNDQLIFGVLGYMTMWFMPVVFMLSLAKMIKNIHDDKGYKLPLAIATSSFWLIVMIFFMTGAN